MQLNRLVKVKKNSDDLLRKESERQERWCLHTPGLFINQFVESKSLCCATFSGSLGARESLLKFFQKVSVSKDFCYRQEKLNRQCVVLERRSMVYSEREEADGCSLYEVRYFFKFFSQQSILDYCLRRWMWYMGNIKKRGSWKVSLADLPILRCRRFLKRQLGQLNTSMNSTNYSNFLIRCGTF